MVQWNAMKRHQLLLEKMHYKWAHKHGWLPEMVQMAAFVVACSSLPHCMTNPNPHDELRVSEGYKQCKQPRLIPNFWKINRVEANNIKHTTQTTKISLTGPNMLHFSNIETIGKMDKWVQIHFLVTETSSNQTLAMVSKIATITRWKEYKLLFKQGWAPKMDTIQNSAKTFCWDWCTQK